MILNVSLETLNNLHDKKLAKAFNTLKKYKVIVPYDLDKISNKNYCLFNFQTQDNLSLSIEDKRRIVNSFKNFSLPAITKVAPFDQFEKLIANSSMMKIVKLAESKNQLINKEELIKALESKGIVYDSLATYIDLVNTKISLRLNPLKVINSHYQSLNTDKEFNITIDNQTYTLSHEYLKQYLIDNSIIGYKNNLDTLIFNSNNVYSTIKNKWESNNSLYSYSALANKVRGYTSTNNTILFGCSNSEELLKELKKDKNLKLLYGMKTTNLEGYHIDEHTRAVLDIFDRYYSNKYSFVLSGFLRVAILGHDLGKGLLNKEYNKDAINKISKSLNINVDDLIYKSIDEGQICLNKAFFDYFTKTLNIKEKYKPLLKFIMFDSQTITNEFFFISKGENKDLINIDLKDAAIEAFNKSFNKDPDFYELNSLISLCLDLQQSDSASYTYYSKILLNDGYYVWGCNREFTNNFKLDKMGNIYLKNNFIYESRLESEKENTHKKR